MEGIKIKQSKGREFYENRAVSCGSCNESPPAEDKTASPRSRASSLTARKAGVHVLLSPRRGGGRHAGAPGPSSSASSSCVTARRPLPRLHLAFSASGRICLCLLLQGPWRSRVGPEGAELSPSRGITKHIKGDGCHTAPAFPCCQWSRAGAGQPQPSTTGRFLGEQGAKEQREGRETTRDRAGAGQVVLSCGCPCPGQRSSVGAARHPPLPGPSNQGLMTGYAMCRRQATKAPQTQTRKIST